jgi:hypothetical protein
MGNQMTRLILIPALVVALTGCASKNDVIMNMDYQQAVIESETARMKAIATIAQQGETGAVAAAMMMQNQGVKPHAAPSSGGGSALAWAQVLVPAAVQSAGIAVTGLVARTQSNNNKDVAIVSSNNSTTVAVDTNATMAAIAETTIVTPEVVTSTNTITCVTDASYTCD